MRFERAAPPGIGMPAPGIVGRGAARAPDLGGRQRHSASTDTIKPFLAHPQEREPARSMGFSGLPVRTMQPAGQRHTQAIQQAIQQASADASVPAPMPTCPHAATSEGGTAGINGNPQAGWLPAEQEGSAQGQRAYQETWTSTEIIRIMLDRGVLSRVVAIANGKGGVGKTSLATTLSGLAAAAGYRILLIDLDPQGNVGEDLGYTGSGTGDDGAGLVTALVAGSPIAVTLPGIRENVDVICGGERLDDLAGLLLSRHRRGVPVTDVLAAPLADLLDRSDYDLVILDCPPGEPNLQLLALGAARWLVVPTRGDAASLKGMTRIAQRLVEARNHNPDLELLGVVLFDIASSATPVSYTHLRAHETDSYLVC